MRRLTGIAAFIAGLLLVTASTQASRAAEAAKFITPSDLVWSDIKTLPPGAQVTVIEGPLNAKTPFIFRIKFRPGWKVPAHMHSVLTHVTVISGKFNLGVGDKFDASKTRALPPGSVVILPPGEPHFAWIDEETVIQVHSIGPWDTKWVDPNDDPANKKIN
jgi:quercetin dioxygenase-like cupin family protein